MPLSSGSQTQVCSRCRCRQGAKHRCVQDAAVVGELNTGVFELPLSSGSQIQVCSSCRYIHYRCKLFGGKDGDVLRNAKNKEAELWVYNKIVHLPRLNSKKQIHYKEMKQFISPVEAAAKVKSGMTVMIGGFLAVGTAKKVVEALANSNVKDLTVICNDTAYVDQGIGLLITNKQIKKLVVSHIGTNANTINQLNSKELEIEFAPQGTLAERIRCGGAGLGGFLTTTGMGTVVAEGKPVVNVDGKDYLLEKPLHADVAIIGATKGDSEGNLVYEGTAQNFNPLMATAADLVIAEVEELVEVGAIRPEYVKTPGIFVDFMVK